MDTYKRFVVGITQFTNSVIQDASHFFIFFRSV